MVDKLVAGPEVSKASYLDPVVYLQNLLRAGIRQLAVANYPAQTPSGEIQLALMRDPIGCAGQSYSVIRPPPARTGQR